MMERRKIVALWRKGGADVLVTLVRVEGSSYRPPGARLLTSSAPPSYAGTISGGCLESEVIRRAAWVSRKGAILDRYSTAFDDTAEIPFGLGCGGTVELLLEPANSPEAEALLQAMEDSLSGRETRVITFFPGGGRPLRRLILDCANEIIFASVALTAEKITCAGSLAPGIFYEGRFVESLQRPQRLFIFGAGDDAKPLAEMATLLGWSVTVADGRNQLARASRFPGAEQVTTVTSPQSLGVGSLDAVVLMTHSYEQDRDLLAATLPIGPKYLGILGSRHRTSLLLTEVASTLARSVASCCGEVFAPIGMDLGGEGPEAIALAILAEVQSVLHGRAGVSRRLRADQVAALLEKGGTSHYLQTQCALGSR